MTSPSVPPGDDDPLKVPDEFAATSFGSMARLGRFIQFQGTSSAEDLEGMRATFLASAADTRRGLHELRARLSRLLLEGDPFDLIARASLVYLHHDPDTYKEWQDDRSPAHIEYLALQALSVGAGEVAKIDPFRASEITFEAIEIVREMFQSTSMLFTSEAISARRARPGDPNIDHRLRAQLESLGVRGSGYGEHLERVLVGCLGPFDQECRNIIGFSASDALTFTRATTDIVSERVTPRWREAAAGRAEMLRAVKRERRKPKSPSRKFPDWLLKLSPKEAALQVGFLTTTWLFAESRNLASVTADELADWCEVDSDICWRFLKAFACPPELYNPDHHALPGGAHPLTERPVLQHSDGFMLPVPSSMIDAIRPRMEDLLREEGSIWGRYADARGTYLEKESASLLAAAIPGSRSWCSIPWRSASDNGDLDGLVSADTLALRIQCKAGRVTASARREAPDRMREDVGKLIREAAEQHERLKAALDDPDADGLGFLLEQVAALAAPLQLDVVVCLDDVTVWATETHRLRTYGGLPSERVPWVLSLLDLMVVVDLLQGAELIHYMVRRQRLERDGRIGAHDELDWVGHYLTEGLFFDHYFEGEHPPARFQLLSYTEPIDAWYSWRAGSRTVETEKPSRKTPPHLAALIARLERERPDGWVMPSVALLNGNQESLDMWEAAIQHVADRIPEPGWSNHTQLFGDTMGMTLYVDSRVEWPEIRAEIADYVSTKMEETGLPNWVAICEGAAGPLFVLVKERDPAFPLVEVFLQPSASSVSGETRQGSLGEE